MNEEQLHKIRHSASHMMAAAVLELYPGTKLGIGPVIENGFYYDFLFPEGIVVSDEDLKNIEKKMKHLIKQNHKFVRKELSAEEAKKQEAGEKFKLELIEDIEKKGEKISFYESGPFHDLCSGPHVESTKEIPLDGLKLQKLAGAYWRGDEKREMLTRIYGLAFGSKEDLDKHLAMLEEAKKRDHRKIGKDQQLFFVDETVGKGLIMWLPNGTIIRDEIEKLAVDEERKGAYVRVVTPHLAKEALFLKSGHLPYYKEGMYPAMVMDDGTYYLKAMNCPHHHMIYLHEPKSYRELPLRMAEYGTVYRNELSGTLAGLLRVRGLAMNDSHIYCRKDQIESEFRSVMELTMKYFSLFGLKDYWFRLSKWSPSHTEKYINEPENWNYAEGILRNVLQEMKVPFVEAEDEAAFYGPKVDVQFRSVIGREETMSTIQLDFAAKTRFGLSYTDETGKENKDVFVIHRAPLSTHERFMAFLIEHYAGIWPVWLAPVQVQIVPVSAKHVEGAEKLKKELASVGIRVGIDNADETVGNKVRKAAGQKIPYILVVGDKELAGEDFMIRVRGQEEQLKMSKDAFIDKVMQEYNSRV